MSRLVLALVSAFLFAGNVHSQSIADSAVYNKGLYRLNAAKTAEQFIETAAYFESVCNEYPQHWLAFYYTGLSYILASQNSGNKKQKDQFLDKAQMYIDKSFALKQGEAELYVLQAFSYQARLLADPQNRSMSFAQKADASIKKAMTADSANPRAYFLMANNIYYTPPIFKGGPKNALPVFLKAREKFRTYQRELSFMPDWGNLQNEEMIQLCNIAQN